jgi:hypothetical protein
MRRALLKVQKTRHSKKSLGQLGGIYFQPLGEFLNQEIVKTPIPTTYVLKHPNQCVLAIGDVHGDLLALLSALYLGGVIDKEARWCGGSAFVVQLGDIFDRSGRGVSQDTSKNPREEIDILQYIHGLNKQAERVGGRVISIVGNHEADKFVGETGTIDRFEGGLLHVNGWGGLFNKRKWFRPKSKLARYFAAFKPVIVQINGFLFCHGGIDSSQSLSVLKTNTLWKQYLLGKLQHLPEAVIDIYWNRRFSQPNPKIHHENLTCRQDMKKIIEKYNLGQDGGLVISHTVQSNGIPFFCDGRVWRIDVALSEAFGRRTTPMEVLRLYFNSTKWSGKTLVQVIRGMKKQSKNTKRSTTEIRNFIGGDLTWVDKISRVEKIKH